MPGMLYQETTARFCRRSYISGVSSLLLVVLSLGCQSAKGYRESADKVAYKIIESKQKEALGRVEPFSIERPSEMLRERILKIQNLPHTGPASSSAVNLDKPAHWPNDNYASETLIDATPPWEMTVPFHMTLEEALQIGARNSREYQEQKERVFRTALDLDLERDEFRHTFAGTMEGLFSSDEEANVRGVEGSGLLSVGRKLASGLSWTAQIGLNLVKLLTLDKSSSLGLFADATVSIPLLRGSGKHIVTEPLTQAERNVVYAIQQFEQYKRNFAVDVASEYLDVLASVERLRNNESNYRSLVASARRARRLADAGRLPGLQVDQAVQNEFRARERWITAQQSLARQSDNLKVLLGLPPDAVVELYEEELEKFRQASAEVLSVSDELAMQDAEIPPATAPIILEPPSLAGAGPYEMEETTAIQVALEHRPDLRIAEGQVYDAQRAVVVAADALRPELTLFGAAGMGEGRSLAGAGEENAELRPEEGRYRALLSLDLPFERTAERNRYRDSYIQLEEAIRRVQEKEDEIKLDVRNALRNLLVFRETIEIQNRAVNLADRRVQSTNLFLEAGRAQIRDLLEAQESLISAQNALVSAQVGYRIAELSLQRDMGVLEVNDQGLWVEYNPQENIDEQ